MSSNLENEIVRHWAAHAPPIEIGGLNASATAYVLTQVSLHSDHKILLVAATAEAAAKLHQSIKTYLCAQTGAYSSLDFFPGWEQSPYRAFAPSMKNKIRRARVLARLIEGDVKLIVTDVTSISQKTPQKKRFSERLFKLSIGDFISREELIERLEEAGYQNVDPAEDPGTYAIRGGICDIFSTSTPYPVRLEFFGDEIESIRPYDVSSQKSAGEQMVTHSIFPAQEWRVNARTIGPAKNKIKEFCDEHGISKKVRDAFFEPIDLGVLEPQLDYLFPFFQAEDSRASTLLEYAQGWKVVLLDKIDIEAEEDSLKERLAQEFEAALADKKIVAPWEELFAPLSLQLEHAPSATFNQLSLGVPEEKPEHALEEPIVDTINLSQPTHIKSLENFDLKDLNIFYEKEQAWHRQNYLRVLFASTASQAERVRYLLEQKGVTSKLTEKVNPKDVSAIQIVEGALSSGFRIPSEKVAILSDGELFGQKKQKSKQSQSALAEMGTFISSLEDLNPSDYVVHHHHGIGKYVGMVKLELDRIPQDFLLLEYAGADKLYLPIYRLDQVQKYLGNESGSIVTLDKLGSGGFEKTKAKVKSELKELAHQLLEMYAKRAARAGFSYSPTEAPYQEFEARFPYPETPDQLKAIEDIMRDMDSEKIMDRLVCGDVGYGKTEVAMRAAYRAVLDGKQVAVLVPTTVLALQHERSFRERFKDTAVRVSSVSRFKSTKEVKQSLEELREGKLDVLIGTHRLLSRDVSFKDLGLLIVDEEQRFGVESKEKIKTLKTATDVLTLTATPIPRTLQMSMMGLRDISIINTPPVDRLSVRTYIAKFDEATIKRAIEQEMARGGQVFFIHNRVQSIHAMYDRIKEVVPQARILIGHGQLPEGALEEVMLKFFNKEADVLLCSTIIESGLDVSSANTMIINRADMFGLSQLYQLRGRVGRSQNRAYCYLLLPEEGAITEDAKKRLEVIQRFVELGSGFKIASHDLELRGGGDILGKSQSGQITAIGYEMFMELLDEAIRGLKGDEIETRFDPEIKLPVPALIPENYIPDVHQRLSAYKRLSDAPSEEALNSLEAEMQDRYGKLPPETQNLIWLIHIKLILRNRMIRALTVGKERIALETTPETRLSPKSMLALIHKQPKMYSLTPDSKIVIKKNFDTAQQLHHDLQSFFSQVAEQ